MSMSIHEYSHCLKLLHKVIQCIKQVLVPLLFYAAGRASCRSLFHDVGSSPNHLVATTDKNSSLSRSWLSR